jgi:uncharacterized protein YndB with AHSA1/START domain
MMAAKITSDVPTLYLERTFAAPRQRVFRARTDPAELSRWFAPSDEHTTKVIMLDVRVGGGYRVEMHSPKGTVHTAMGSFREVQPPERLVFTWTWEGKDMGETLVTLEFQDRAGSTHLVLSHELFPTQELRDEHSRGWDGCLSRLAMLVAP